ncbi:rRNA maturation RNase YbeY [Tepidibacillus infernus]|uniref:Endoribonuclease YbeY n=1 Tax=Tepidibacillus decaturensis TaxID=1413211 RepID=A0A135L2N1_9BACI|nr:rRNA maturation RNase YbeY [Tepidibacillus decaturensis]KXG43187.1 rRNA maturation factor [Tepidibacillus decaturensis]
MIDVDVLDEQEEREILEKEIELVNQVIQTAAELEGITEGEVVVTLVDNKRIHELNRDYRGIDRPTDVLSFALNEPGEDDLDIVYDEEMDMPTMLGDIVISIPKVIQQAADYGHSFERELGFLTAHGFLHLLGYDHETKEDEKVMFTKQELILEKMKLSR